MQRVNQYQFYDFAVYLHPITQLLTTAKVSESMWPLYRAKTWVQYFLENRVVPLVVCRPYGFRLVAEIDNVIPADFPVAAPADGESEIGFRARVISDATREFETVLAAELQALDTYFISQKGIYSTPDLIERADNALDEDVRRIINPEAVKDFKQAGRCLAFDLPTAAGFHAMRATENVLRQYHKVAVPSSSSGSTPEMATCINELKKAGADEKTMAVIDQIRDLHRNTIMHPEVFLSPSEGLRLFDIAKSAISAMADQIGTISIAIVSTVAKAAAATTP